MVRDSSKCVLAGLMWPIITVAVSAPGVLLGQVLASGLTGTGPPPAWWCHPSLTCTKLCWTPSGVSCSKVTEEAAELDQESLLGSDTQDETGPQGRPTPSAVHSDASRCGQEAAHLKATYLFALPVCLPPPCFLQNGGDSTQLGMERKLHGQTVCHGTGSLGETVSSTSWEYAGMG